MKAIIHVVLKPTTKSYRAKKKIILTATHTPEYALNSNNEIGSGF